MTFFTKTQEIIGKIELYKKVTTLDNSQEGLRSQLNIITDLLAKPNLTLLDYKELEKIKDKINEKIIEDMVFPDCHQFKVSEKVRKYLERTYEEEIKTVEQEEKLLNLEIIRKKEEIGSINKELELLQEKRKTLQVSDVKITEYIGRLKNLFEEV